MPKLQSVKPGEVKEVTLPSESDVKVEDRTIFLITSPDVRDVSKIQNSLYQVRGVGKTRKEEFRTGEQQLEFLKIGLKGWKNFVEPDGTDVKWVEPDTAKNAQEREKILIDNINRIPEAARGELVDLIRGETFVDQD